jgi:hypothetical protein
MRVGGVTPFCSSMGFLHEMDRHNMLIIPYYYVKIFRKLKKCDDYSKVRGWNLNY